MDISTHDVSDRGRMLAGILCGAGAGALWGLVFLAPELAGDFGALQLTIGRYVAYGILSAALIAPRWKALTAALSRGDWIRLGWLAISGNILYYIFLTTAVQTGGIAMTSLVIGFLPVAVTIIGSRDRGAVPLARLAPSLLLCAVGAVSIGWQTLSTPDAGSFGQQLTGFLCAIAALVSWTCFAILNSRSLSRLRTISAHDWSLLTGIVTGALALVLVPFALLFEPMQHGVSAWLRFAGVSIGVALLASVVGNALWNRMNRLLPLTMVGQMILFETLFALLYGFAWEQRLPRPMEIVAFVFVVASVLTCIAAHRRSFSPSEVKAG